MLRWLHEATGSPRRFGARNDRRSRLSLANHDLLYKNTDVISGRPCIDHMDTKRMSLAIEEISIPEPQAYLARLNAAQRLAVEYGADGTGAGPLLVIAGAGSGKTSTLAHRVAHLIAQGADPSAVLLLTFSRRAAEEMVRRAERIVRQLASPRHRRSRSSPGPGLSTASARACCANTPGASASTRRSPSTTARTRPT